MLYFTELTSTLPMSFRICHHPSIFFFFKFPNSLASPVDFLDWTKILSHLHPWQHSLQTKAIKAIPWFSWAPLRAFPIMQRMRCPWKSYLWWCLVPRGQEGCINASRKAGLLALVFEIHNIMTRTAAWHSWSIFSWRQELRGERVILAGVVLNFVSFFFTQF